MIDEKKMYNEDKTIRFFVTQNLSHHNNNNKAIISKIGKNKKHKKEKRNVNNENVSLPS